MTARRFSRRWLLLLWTIALGCSREEGPSKTETVAVAAASNFSEPLQALARAFEAESGASVRVSSGSSGKLFAQIENGAPFDVFLSADRARPARLEQRGLAVEGTRFTYAVGRLALYGPAIGSDGDGLRALRAGRFEHLAIANPDTAPYGLAARQALEKLGLWTALGDKLVRGENIAQTHQFVESEAAALGLVALSQVHQGARYPYWEVSRGLYEPIEQDAVLLDRGRQSAAARRFVQFLRGPKARRIIEAAGYDTRGEAGQR